MVQAQNVVVANRQTFGGALLHIKKIFANPISSCWWLVQESGKSEKSKSSISIPTALQIYIYFQIIGDNMKDYSSMAQGQ